mgnify:CR=1 FL=1
MAKARTKASSEENEEVNVVDPEDSEGTEEQKQGQAPKPGQQVTLDESKAVACYANFCRVTGTPEEVILDLGLNPQPFGMPERSISVSQRLILNYYTAKRLLGALSMTIQRHEQAFGVLETDVQKRAVGAAANRPS